MKKQVAFARLKQENCPLCTEKDWTRALC